MARFYNFLDGFHDFHSVLRRFAFQKWNFEGGTFPHPRRRKRYQRFDSKRIKSEQENGDILFLQQSFILYVV